ncbi:hypothetical protein ZONE111905_13450 [Zobellia nedashkovskayae]
MLKIIEARIDKLSFIDYKLLFIISLNDFKMGYS